ncbi:MAG TPA: GWxTD domain-containing protein [Bacteroidota bacterium]
MNTLGYISKKRLAFILWGVLLSPGSVTVSQVEFSRAGPRFDTNFYYDVIAVSSDQPGKSRIDVYVEVPYRELHFVKIGNEYVASFEETVQLLTRDKQLVDQRSWNNEVSVKDFSETSSDKHNSLTHQQINVTPGDFEISVQIYEPEIQKRTNLHGTIRVTDFGKDELSFSDIMLVNKLTKAGDKTGIIPNVAASFPRQTDGFYLFFEAYHISPVDSLFLVCHIFNSAKKEVWKKDEAEPPSESKLQIFIKVDSTMFPAGQYTVVVDGYNARSGSNPDLKATTSRRFSIHWSDMPMTISSIEKAVDELRYVAKSEEIDYIEAGTTDDEKRKRFLEFWNKRNPDPSSDRNALMEEYYRRVDYANKAFTRYTEGWKTDMGMVYIRLGPPENIERHPFEMDTKPYEVWYYYQLNRECVFVDYSGFGDYRLQNPTADLFRGLR